MKYDIKEMVKDGKKAKVTHYKLGELWYETETGFKFPVPVHNSDEIGDAQFNSEEKALLLMRYIRKHIAMLEEAETLHHNSVEVTSTEQGVDSGKPIC